MAESKKVSLPKWDTLNALGKSRVLRSSYLWLIVVPIAAKALSSVENPIVLTGLGEGLVLSLTLPFSWKLFYFSSVSISVAGLIYSFRCPEIIRKFKSFGQYMSEVGGGTYLANYVGRPKLSDTVDKNDRILSQFFWEIYAGENKKRVWWRFICMSFYLAGLLLVTIVMIQNFIFVLNIFSRKQILK